VECERARALIDAYVDRELAVDVSAEMQQHIESCAACRRRYEGRRALSAICRNPGLYKAARRGLRRRIVEAIARVAARLAAAGAPAVAAMAAACIAARCWIGTTYCP